MTDQFREVDTIEISSDSDEEASPEMDSPTAAHNDEIQVVTLDSDDDQQITDVVQPKTEQVDYNFKQNCNIVVKRARLGNIKAQILQD